MSRIDDDNSDLARIREMQASQLKQQKADEARNRESALRRSFQQVMGDKNARQTAGNEAQRAAPKTDGQEGKRVLERLRKEAPKGNTELARKAALARSLTQQAASKRRSEVVDGAKVEEQRRGEVNQKSELETEQVERERRREDDREVARAEVRREEAAALGREGPVQLDPREERRDKGRQERGDGKDEPRSEGVASTQQAQRTAPAQIPRELIERLVDTLYTAVKADGRTSIQMTLKGGKLEGVTLEVRAENGAIHCQFGNCDPQLRAMLNAGRSALAQALGRRGLKLATLQAS
jgi:hypothetical protein